MNSSTCQRTNWRNGSRESRPRDQAGKRMMVPAKRSDMKGKHPSSTSLSLGTQNTVLTLDQWPQDHRDFEEEPLERSGRVRGGGYRPHAQGRCLLQETSGPGGDSQTGHQQQELQVVEELGTRCPEDLRLICTEYRLLGREQVSARTLWDCSEDFLGLDRRYRATGLHVKLRGRRRMEMEISIRLCKSMMTPYRWFRRRRLRIHPHTPP